MKGMIRGKYFYPDLRYLCAHLIPWFYAYMKKRLESNNFVTVLGQKPWGNLKQRVARPTKGSWSHGAKAKRWAKNRDRIGIIEFDRILRKLVLFQSVSRPRNNLKTFSLARGAVRRWSTSPQPYLPCLWNSPLSQICVAGQPQEVVYQTPYISWACQVTPINAMGASNMLRGNLGCGSVRPPPDGPMKMHFEHSLFGNSDGNFWDTRRDRLAFSLLHL